MINYFGTAEKSKNSGEATNSEEGPVTIILFSFNRNPTSTELKKTFAVKKGKLFQARKKHANVAEVFDTLFAVKAARPSEEIFFDYMSKNSTTHFYIIDQGIIKKEFAILKYGAQLLGGFNCFFSELKEIHDLLEAYKIIAFFSMEGRRSLNRLHLQIDEISKSQRMDLSVYKNLLFKSSEELNEVTYPIICSAKEKVDEWYERHFWRDEDVRSFALNNNFPSIRSRYR